MRSSIAVYGLSEPGAGPERQSRAGRCAACPQALPAGCGLLPLAAPRGRPERPAPSRIVPPGCPEHGPASPRRSGRAARTQSPPPAALRAQPGLRHRGSRPRASGQHRRRLFCVAASTRERTEPFRAVPTGRGRGNKTERRGAAGAKPPPAAPFPLLRPR